MHAYSAWNIDGSKILTCGELVQIISRTEAPITGTPQRR